MADRPIIFSSSMVRAILEGRKTQTRRIINPQPQKDGPSGYGDLGVSCLQVEGRDRPQLTFGKVVTRQYLPFAVGDSLWVRETCRAEELSRPQFERPATAKERALLKRMTVIECPEDDGADGVRYLADDAWRKIENTPEAGEAWSALFHYRGRGKGRVGNTVPPIHMPRWASRITLRVTAVRVQRLQDISEEDARAEGSWPPTGYKPGTRGDFIGGFAFIWESIHGPGAWDANPWVAAITFERVQ